MLAHRRSGPAGTLALLFVSVFASRASAQTIAEFPLPGGAFDSSIGFSGYAVQGITAGSDGNLWLTEPRARRIARVTPDGGVTEFGVGAMPLGIAAGPDGALWYTTFGGYPSDPRIGRMTTRGETTELGNPFGGAWGEFPTGIAVGPDGDLWFTLGGVLAASEHAPALCSFTGIGRVTTSGVFTGYPYAAYPGGETDDELLLGAIVAGPGGQLWFGGDACGAGTEGFGRILRMSTAGVGTRVAATPAGASGLALGPDGNVWFTPDIWTKRNTIGRLTPAGELTEFPVPTPDSRPMGIAAGPDGNLWFTEWLGNKIGRITPAGTVTEFPIPTPDSRPWTLTFGPDGNLWFVEAKGGRVGRLAVPGATTTLTIPAAASSRGLNGTFFRSDLWLLNRSFSLPARVGLTYRCFAGQSCDAKRREVVLAPRQSVTLPDVVGSFLSAPGTAGAIEIDVSGPVSARSRVFTSSSSDAGMPTLGASIPALPASAARSSALFLGMASNGGAATYGFRTNAGAYNPNAAAVTIRFELFSSEGAPLGRTERTLGPREAMQLPGNVFESVGAARVTTTSAFLVVTADAPVFSYAIVIDNGSGDSTFVEAQTAE